MWQNHKAYATCLEFQATHTLDVRVSRYITYKVDLHKANIIASEQLMAHWGGVMRTRRDLPEKSPKNRLKMMRNSGRMFSLISDLLRPMPNSVHNPGRPESTSPTVWANILYNGSNMKSTKVRCEVLEGARLEKRRLLKDRKRRRRMVSNKRVANRELRRL